MNLREPRWSWSSHSPNTGEPETLFSVSLDNLGSKAVRRMEGNKCYTLATWVQFNKLTVAKHTAKEGTVTACSRTLHTPSFCSCCTSQLWKSGAGQGGSGTVCHPTKAPAAVHSFSGCFSPNKQISRNMTKQNLLLSSLLPSKRSPFNIVTL